MLRRLAILAFLATLLSCSPLHEEAAQTTQQKTDVLYPLLETDFRVCGTDLPGLECSTIAVDRDRSTKDIEPISVRVGLLRSFNPKPSGSVFINPGGPGASAVGFLSSISGSISQIRQTHDVYAVDPRGTGGSSPLNCDYDLKEVFGLDLTPDSAEEADIITSSEADYVRSCVRDSAGMIGYMSSVDSATDMRDVLDVLGIDKMNYLGFSYGSELGAVFASLFPDRVGRFVFDGASDFRKSFIESSLEQGRGFEQALNDYTARCDRSSCFDAPAGEILSRALSLVESGYVTNNGDVVDSGVLYVGLASMLYLPNSDMVITKALSEVLEGKSDSLHDAFSSYLSRDQNGEDNGAIDAFRAITTEDKSKMTLQEQEELLEKAKENLPFFWPVFSQTVIREDPWPDTGPAPEFKPLLPPGRVLYVAATGDPATTYGDTIGLSEDLRAYSLTRVGSGHTSYFFSSCIREQVMLFFVSRPLTTTECATDGI